MANVKASLLKKKSNIFFSAASNSGLSIIPDAQERISGNRVYWGADDMFPSYIRGLYQRSSIVQSIIDGTSEYIAGNGIININNAITRYVDHINDDNEDLLDIVNKAIWSIQIYGGVFFLLTKSNDNTRIYINVIDPQIARINTDMESGLILRIANGRIMKTGSLYPIFKGWDNIAEIPEQSIYYYGGRNLMGYYPTPRYISALKAIDTTVRIESYYNSLVRNGFSLSGFLQICTDGLSDEEIKDLEQKLKEKYAGEYNAGGIMMHLATSGVTKSEYTQLHSNDLDKQYIEVSRATIDSIYSAFRAVPALFGLMTQTTGFSQQEFIEAYSLYHTSVIMPARNQIINIFNDIFNIKDSFEFTPLALEAEAQTTLATTLGPQGVSSLSTIITDTSMTIEQKRGLIEVLYNIDLDKIDKFLPLNTIANV